MANQHSKKGKGKRISDVLKTIALIHADFLNLDINPLDI